MTPRHSLKHITQCPDGGSTAQMTTGQDGGEGIAFVNNGQDEKSNDSSSWKKKINESWSGWWCESVAFVNNGQDVKNKDSSSWKKKIKCFNCVTEGHYANQCTNPRKTNGDKESEGGTMETKVRLSV